MVLGCKLHLRLRGNKYMEKNSVNNLVIINDMEQDEELLKMQAEEQAKEIERLRLWNERMEAERKANQAEADALAIIIAEQKRQPTIEQRVSEIEQVTTEVITALNDKGIVP